MIYKFIDKNNTTWILTITVLMDDPKYIYNLISDKGFSYTSYYDGTSADIDEIMKDFSTKINNMIIDLSRNLGY